VVLGQGRHGRMVGELLGGPVSACGPDMDVGDWLRRWRWRRVRLRLGSTLTAIGACQEGFGGGDVARAAGYLAHVPRRR
jgi:hypothetical protein